MSSGYIQVITGKFWEHAGQRVVGGEISHNNENGDVCNWSLEATFEFKGSHWHSNYGLKLHTLQFGRYQKRVTGFPFSTCMYGLFCYENKFVSWEGKRRTELSFLHDPDEIYPFLAKRVQWCILLDFSIISRIMETHPKSTTSTYGHKGMESVDLKCRWVHNFVNNDLRNNLSSLDLSPTDYRTVSGKIRTWITIDPPQRYHLRFPFTMVLHKDDLRKFRGELRERGIDTTLKHLR